MKFRLSETCFKNRGDEGIVDFVANEAKSLIRRSIEIQDEKTGFYELRFVKTGDISSFDGSEIAIRQ